MYSGILTIDDVPSEITPGFVDYLNEKRIRPVMFAVGQAAETFYAHGIYALRHGMIIGNHSYSHPAFSTLTYDEAISQIARCENILNQMYADAGVERKNRLFRFPYGDRGGENAERLQEYLRNQGFDKLPDTQIPFAWWREAGLDREISTHWTFDFAEYQIRKGTGFTMDDVFARMNDPAPSQSAPLFADGARHIMLLHNHTETMQLVPDYYRQIIDTMLDRGFVFENPLE